VSRRPNCLVISLDAAKAFDKLWRDGLFYKIKPRTEAGVWRILHQYYGESYAVVYVGGLQIVGNVNTSVLTYCDDILLLASNEIKIH